MRRMLSGTAVAAFLAVFLAVLPQRAHAAGPPPFTCPQPYQNVVGTLVLEGGAGTPPIQIQVLGFEFKASAPTSIGSASSGAGAGKATFNEFVLTKALDGTSPLLFKALFSGAHFTRATLTIPGESTTYSFGLVFVTSQATTDDGTGSAPVEQVGLAFGELFETFGSASTTSTPVSAGWNLVVNTELTSPP